MLFGCPRHNITHIAHREVKVIYITDKKFFVMQELHVTINLRHKWTENVEKLAEETVQA